MSRCDDWIRIRVVQPGEYASNQNGEGGRLTAAEWKYVRVVG
jgi:hypothetical protein